MTVAEYTYAMFSEDFPEFSDAPTYEAKFDAAMLAAPPKFDEARWGDELRDGLGHWIAFRISLKGQIAAQGAGFASAASSSIQKTVGKVSITTSQSQSQSSNTTNGGGYGTYGTNAYGRYYMDLVRLVGAGMEVI